MVRNITKTEAISQASKGHGRGKCLEVIEVCVANWKVSVKKQINREKKARKYTLLRCLFDAAYIFTLGQRAAIASFFSFLFLFLFFFFFFGGGSPQVIVLKKIVFVENSHFSITPAFVESYNNNKNGVLH